jgi:hypothetical protein
MPPSAYVLLEAATGRIAAQLAPDIRALPGSTVKPFLAATGVFPCRRTLAIGGHRLDCTHPPALGLIDANDALALSCNCYFAAFALTIPPAEQQHRLRDFESLLATTDERRQLQALGHWGVRASPLSMARAYRRLLMLDGLPGLSGKTGTTRDGAWYAGWNASPRPRWVISVFTGGRGGTDAYQAAKEILDQWAFR